LIFEKHIWDKEIIIFIGIVHFKLAKDIIFVNDLKTRIKYNIKKYGICRRRRTVKIEYKHAKVGNVIRNRKNGTHNADRKASDTKGRNRSNNRRITRWKHNGAVNQNDRKCNEIKAVANDRDIRGVTNDNAKTKRDKVSHMISNHMKKYEKKYI
jgi:hypothetical protein